jgi:hypothetical protein
VDVSYNDGEGVALRGKAEHQKFVEKALAEGWQLESEQRLREDWSAIYQCQVPREQGPLISLSLRYPGLGLSSKFAVDGSTFVVALPEKNLVQIYEWDGETWQQSGTIDAGRKLGKWCFGTGVAIHGEQLRVGASKLCFLFERQGVEWKLVREEESSGSNESLRIVRGNIAAVGDPFRYDRTGCVEIFFEVDGAWKLVRELQLADCRFDDMFGACIAFHEDRLLVAGRRRIHAFAINEL